MCREVSPVKAGYQGQDLLRGPAPAADHDKVLKDRFGQRSLQRRLDPLGVQAVLVTRHCHVRHCCPRSLLSKSYSLIRLHCRWLAEVQATITGIPGERTTGRARDLGDSEAAAGTPDPARPTVRPHPDRRHESANMRSPLSSSLIPLFECTVDRLFTG